MALVSHLPETEVATNEQQREAMTRDFSEIYRENFAFVWRAARRLGVDERHQDDVVQEVFVVVHRKLATFEERSSLRTWLYGITLRVVRDHRRSRARRDEATGQDFDTLAAGEDVCPVQDLQRNQAARMLRAILDTMDEEKREVFVLSELEQLAMPEVAEVLNVNVNTAHARLRAARQIFEAAVARLRVQDKWRTG